MQKLLEISNLSFSYPQCNVLKNITFSLEKGSISCIVSPNNCGRTTLIKLLSGMLWGKGEIKLDGTILTKKNLKKHLKSIGVCFLKNHPLLFDDVFSELLFPLENLLWSDREIEDRMDAVLETLEIKSVKYHKIKNLTTFEKIKVILASSVIHNPKILILDDLLEDLELEEVQEIYRLLHKITLLWGTTVLFTTRRIECSLRSDQIFIMHEGMINLSGSPREILEHDNTLVKNGIELPIMLDLSLKLKFYNLIEDVIMDVDGMVDVLWP